MPDPVDPQPGDAPQLTGASDAPAVAGDASTGGTPPPWHRRHHRAVFIGSIVGALLLGAAAGGSGPQQELADAQAALKRARGEVISARERADEATEQARTAERRAREKADEELAAERARLDDRASELSSRSAALDRRERKVSGLEATAKRNSFDGDGTYLVGPDIKPGTYRAPASPGCYWARLSSLDTSNIIDNNNADGPVVLQILPSDKALQVARCGRFTRVGE